MGHFKINQKDIHFILKEQLAYGSLCGLERYQDLNEKALDMLVAEALKFAKGIVDPLQEIGEEWGGKACGWHGCLSARVPGRFSTIWEGWMDRGSQEHHLWWPRVSAHDAHRGQRSHVRSLPVIQHGTQSHPWCCAFDREFCNRFFEENIRTPHV